MCNDPYCRHPYVCANCGDVCSEDETEGCAACLPNRFEEAIAAMTELCAEAQWHIDNGHSVRVWRSDLVGQRDIVPRLMDLFLSTHDFDEARERRRLREVAR